jgi:hypothetical protein
MIFSYRLPVLTMVDYGHGNAVLPINILKQKNITALDLEKRIRALREVYATLF